MFGKQPKSISETFKPEHFGRWHFKVPILYLFYRNIIKVYSQGSNIEKLVSVQVMATENSIHS